jgi:hypothetical protein
VQSLHAVASPRKGSRPACAHEARPADAIDFSDQLLAALSEYDWAADDGLVEEYRPTIAEPPYEPPSEADDAWMVGFDRGYWHENDQPPADYGVVPRCAFRLGYLAGEDQRAKDDFDREEFAAEYGAWLDQIERERSFEDAGYGYSHQEFRG